MRFTIILFCLFTLFSFSAKAQTETEEVVQVTVILTDKSEIKGELMSENEREIVINSTTLGLITFERSEIKTILYFDAKGRRANPNPTRYFLGQSSFTLPKGEGYYQNIYGLFNLVSYGITDRFSVSAGTEIITLLQGFPILFTNLKYGIPISKKLQGAVSFTYLTSGGNLGGNLNLGSLNALITYGDKEHNLTFGTGYALANGEINDTGLLTIAGMTRVTGRLALLTENYILPSQEGSLISGGVRYIAKKLTIDLLIFETGIPAIDIVLTF